MSTSLKVFNPGIGQNEALGAAIDQQHLKILFKMSERAADGGSGNSEFFCGTAPINPMPVTIWAATRDGSSTMRSVIKTSVKPYFEISKKSAAVVPITVYVRSPALL